MTKRLGPLVTILVLLACPTPPIAGPVYKSVDADGNITYSSSPPAEQRGQQVEEVKLAPGPSQQEVEAANKRLQDIERAEYEQNKQRQQQQAEQSKAKESADSELRRAQQDLEQAKIQRDSDWQYLQQGGRVLRQSYFDRVKAAEARVSKARDAQRGSGR